MSFIHSNNGRAFHAVTFSPNFTFDAWKIWFFVKYICFWFNHWPWLLCAVFIAIDMKPSNEITLVKWSENKSVHVQWHNRVIMFIKHFVPQQHTQTTHRISAQHAHAHTHLSRHLMKLYLWNVSAIPFFFRSPFVRILNPWKLAQPSCSFIRWASTVLWIYFFLSIKQIL